MPMIGVNLHEQVKNGTEDRQFFDLLPVRKFSRSFGLRTGR